MDKTDSWQEFKEIVNIERKKKKKSEILQVMLYKSILQFQPENSNVLLNF